MYRHSVPKGKASLHVPHVNEMYMMMCPSPLRKPSSLAPVRLACASLSTVIMAAAGFWQPVFSAFCQGLFIFPIPPPAWSSIKGLPRKIPRSGVEGSGVFLLSTFSMGAGGTPQFLLRRRSGLCVFWMKTSSSPLCTGRRTCSCVLWQRTEQLLWASGELVSPGISAEEFAPYYHWNPH